jgi:PAS domain S-box-containing protein
VLTVLLDYPQGISIIDLSEKIDIHRNVLAKYLKILEAQGKIEINKIGTSNYIKISNRIAVDFFKEYSAFPVIIFNNKMRYVDDNSLGKTFLKKNSYLLKYTDLNSSDFLFEDNNLNFNLQSALKGIKSSGFVEKNVDNKTQLLRYKTVPLVFDDGTRGAGLLFSNTDYEEIQNILNKTLATYQSFLDNQIQFILRISSSGTVISMNNSFARHIGFDPESNNPHPNFIPSFPEDTSRLYNESIRKISRDLPVIDLNIRRLISTGELAYEKWRIRGIFDENDQISEFQAEGLDISDIRREEQDLQIQLETMKKIMEQRTSEIRGVNQDLQKEIIRRESMETYLHLVQNVINTAYDVIFILNSDGEIFYVNEKAEKITGINKQILIGKKIDTYILFSESINSKYTLSDLIKNSEDVTSIIHGTIISWNNLKINFEIAVNSIKMDGNIYFCLICREVQEKNNQENIRFDNNSIINNDITDVINDRNNINALHLSNLWPKFE